MKPQRIAAIIFVIGGGLIGSYYIIKNSMPSPDAVSIRENSLNSQNNGDIAGKKSINWLAQAVNSAGSLLGGGNDSSNNSVNDNTQSQGSQNLTNLVASSLFGHMKSIDQSGSDPFATTTFDPNNPDSQKLLKDTISGINGVDSLFNQTVRDSDLKISNNNSSEAKRNYLNNINTISQNRLSDKRFRRNADQIINDADIDCAGAGGPSSVNGALANAYAAAAADYLNVGVPSDWKNIHIEMVEYFKNASDVYRALNLCVDDPVKGYIAAQTIPALLNKALIAQNEISAKAKETGL